MSGSAAALEGALTLDRVAALLPRGDAVPAVWDLSAVTRVDSAGVALLLELARRVRARGQTPRFERPPAQLVELAQVLGVAVALALDTQNASEPEGVLA